MVAAAAVANRLGLTADRVEVNVPGGRAIVELEAETSWVTGPALTVFVGEIDLP
jgi:diaminopimelate epimerase